MKHLLFICAVIASALAVGPPELDWQVYEDGASNTNQGATTPCPAWHYDQAANWGDICPDYATCGAGHKQSPIDISQNGGVSDYHIGDLELTDFVNTNTSILNNGHTVNVFVGGAKLTGGPLFSDSYTLTQFHFHAPSEHTIEGKHSAIEFHWVHQNTATGDLAVIGVLFDVSPQPNLWFESFINKLPTTVGGVNYATVDAYGALPDNLEYYHYAGSLTTPPCSEGVKWLVLKEVQQISQTQLDRFLHLFEEANNRPEQDLNGRTIFHDDGAHDDVDQPCELHKSINFNFNGLVTVQKK